MLLSTIATFIYQETLESSTDVNDWAYQQDYQVQVIWSLEHSLVLFSLFIYVSSHSSLIPSQTGKLVYEKGRMVGVLLWASN